MGTQEQLSTATGLTELCRLADKYGTDKAGCYTPFYDLLFAARREKVYKVLEIGIGTVAAMKHVPFYVPGASLRMWKEYFPNAEIHGLDKDAEAVNTPLGDRIITHRADQRYTQDLEDVLPILSLGGRFDLIVDDGSHEPEDQLRTFRVLSRALDYHGVYIIEDAGDDSSIGPYLPDYSYVEHNHIGLTGKLILIRGEAIHG